MRLIARIVQTGLDSVLHATLYKVIDLNDRTGKAQGTAWWKC